MNLLFISYGCYSFPRSPSGQNNLFITKAWKKSKRKKKTLNLSTFAITFWWNKANFPNNVATSSNRQSFVVIFFSFININGIQFLLRKTVMLTAYCIVAPSPSLKAKKKGIIVGNLSRRLKNRTMSMIWLKLWLKKAIFIKLFFIIVCFMCRLYFMGDFYKINVSAEPKGSFKN